MVEPEEFEIPGGRARIGWIEYEEDGQIAFQAVCDVVSGPSQYLITAAYMHKEEKGFSGNALTISCCPYRNIVE